MAVIGELPRGLVALLALRDSGETPRDLAATAVGTVELSELYMLQRRELVGVVSQPAPTVGANFFPTPLIVPPGELWFVWEYVVAVTTGVADDLCFAASVNIDGLSLSVPVGPFEAGILGAGVVQNVRARSDGHFYAGPGSEFGFVAKYLVGGTPTFFAALVITRLRV